MLAQELSVLGLSVHYYGVILGLAVLAGFFVARKNAWRFGLSVPELDRMAFWLIIISIIGARLYFVIFELQYFAAHPAEIVQLWNGGISIYGAILSGLLFIWWWGRKTFYTRKQILDLVALALPLGQAFGRWGNFINYEAYGAPTNLPWKMFVPEQFRVDLAQSYYHPVFLYESLASLVIFTTLMLLRGKVKSGNLALIYLMGYSLVRFFLEYLRVDSVFIAGWRVDQIVSALVFLVAVILLARSRIVKVDKIA